MKTDMESSIFDYLREKVKSNRRYNDDYITRDNLEIGLLILRSSYPEELQLIDRLSDDTFLVDWLIMFSKISYESLSEINYEILERTVIRYFDKRMKEI